MASKVLPLVGAAVTILALSIVNGLRSNLRKARKTRIPYVIVPCSPYTAMWRLTFQVWVFFIKLLPKSMWEGWLFIMLPDWGYSTGQEHFARLGDTFLVVAPFYMNLYTQSPAAIHEIASRREHFPKATKNYRILEIFGRNVLTTEGAVWRFHRKATSASFNEKNAAHTFAEAIHQAQGLVAKWNDTAQSDSPTIMTIEKDTMTLALNIIGYVGFGLRFTWPGQALPADTHPRMRKYGSQEPPSGHTMTFAASVEGALHNIIMLLLMPAPLLKFLSLFLARAHTALHSYVNYVQYMNEFLVDKVASAKEDAEKGIRAGDMGMDIMGQLVRGRYNDEVEEDKTTKKARSADKALAESTLTDDEIIGNAFIMLVAGHETTANSLHFALLELATNPASQRALQADVDRLLGRDSDPSTWDYEASINGMLASMLGAAMNETLRLMPPVINLPKLVTPTADQPLALPETGQTHILPAGCDVILSAVTVQRHPKYWPALSPADLDMFRPARWFEKDAEAAAVKAKDAKLADIVGADTEDYGGFSGPDTSAQLFRPVRGSFVPFSDGPRSCLGRRIAQVEMLAALAVLFQRYSIELAVDDWADDKQVAAMDDEARRELYSKAQARCRATLRSAISILTLKLHGKSAVPVRLVPRGQERFVHCVDARTR
ncbi:cytochrome p450 monooxygenase [Sporothrix brasiliensis 5110]|uniref:Cytochrome p450 monooxygenase n=1 Tax=Sporothrix brasiliensis 5110 TaxID=1398154 RepID=A0A0C2INN8_9PEZI|nr:cytochrome p450 monooxygenase [Sporothrix brasiliensis 5110]KIH88595.1 cytochrome p450 monooxygenase [Sporothrix brasiliensis 5110]